MYVFDTLDIITHEPIHIERAVYIHKQVYDANSLLESIVYSYKHNEIPTIPHNRESYTKEMLLNIYYKSDPKSEIIIEIIKLLKFPKETQTILLSLSPEKRKIILCYKYNKIKILINLSSPNIEFLLLKYDYLLNDDIFLTDDIIKKLFGADNMSLLFIPDDKITDNIIKYVIHNNYRAIKYISENKMTDEIIKYAINFNIYVLQYIPKYKMTFNIIMNSVKNNGYALQYVPEK